MDGLNDPCAAGFCDTLPRGTGLQRDTNMEW